MTNPITTANSQNLAIAKHNLQIGKCYRHYKGKIFQVLNLGKFEGTEEKDVVIYTYVDNLEKKLIFVRPIDEFLGNVQIHNEEVPRFEPVQTDRKAPITRINPETQTKSGLKIGQTFLHYKGSMVQILNFGLYEAANKEEQVVLYVSADFPSNVEFKVFVRPITDFNSFVDIGGGKIVNRFTKRGEHISI